MTGNGDHGAGGEAAHVRLAAGDTPVGPVGLSVDHQRAGAADALAAIVGESDRFVALQGELVVQDVEHLQKRHVRIQVVRGIVDKAPPVLGARLAPHANGDGNVPGCIFGRHVRASHL